MKIRACFDDYYGWVFTDENCVLAIQSTESLDIETVMFDILHSNNANIKYHGTTFFAELCTTDDINTTCC